MAMVISHEYKMGETNKRILARNVLTLIEFGQSIVQGLWKDDDPFMQLPHMTDEKLAKIKKIKKGLTFDSYC